jgi:hypothetical protein
MALKKAANSHWYKPDEPKNFICSAWNLEKPKEEGGGKSLLLSPRTTK